MSFCSKCGRQNDDTAGFCGGCGNPINANAQSANFNAANGPVIVGGHDPLFHCKCEYCYCEFEYKTKDLGYRAWYPHGFVYCPSCKKPLRHRLEYEVR